MAKDYFQDIIPPSNPNRRMPPAMQEAPPKAPDISSVSPESSDPVDPAPERSIRNIPISRSRRPDMREVPPGILGARPPARSRWWLWGAAVLSVFALAMVALLAFRSTAVTVIPRSHTVVFDQNSLFTASPAETASTGSLAYTVETVELEDSEVAPSSGTVRAEDKASGTITVFNAYSTDPVRLIKNTRFEAAGLVFRTPAEIVVPGKRGTTPGQVRVTVVADQPGQQYNIEAARFTLPGLKSSSDMYAAVYAQSDSAMSGGFVGDKPGVSQSAMDAAVAAVRARLEQKARDAARALMNTETTAFPGLIRITYQDMPTTTEAGGGVRIHQKARVEIPVFSSSLFAQTVARTVSADAETSSIRLVPGDGFAAGDAATSTVLGTDTLQFNLSGTAQLIWNINEAELTQALAGRDKVAFQSLVKAFPGIQEARARIEPFWSSTFPADPSDIQIKVQDPAN